MGHKCVHNGSDILVSPVQKVPVCVRHGVLIITRRNIVVFMEAEESL